MAGVLYLLPPSLVFNLISLSDLVGMLLAKFPPKHDVPKDFFLKVHFQALPEMSCAPSSVTGQNSWSFLGKSQEL